MSEVQRNLVCFRRERGSFGSGNSHHTLVVVPASNGEVLIQMLWLGTHSHTRRNGVRPMAALSITIEQRVLSFLNVSPVFDSLRSHPRFGALQRLVGLT